ncbi:MAG: sulfotransferase family protein [Chloroflexota bacterium]
MSGLEARLRREVVRAARAWHRHRGPAPAGPPPPPDCPPGWRTGPPDFIGIGAQKAGTTWWHALIDAHPDVQGRPGQPKELHAFDTAWERGWSDADSARYARYFPRPEGGVAGEWTPGYVIDFWTPACIARAAPDARILLLLRDPVERFRSGLTHTDDATTATLSHRDAAGAFQRGLYAQQLRRVLDAIPRERLLVLQHEACRADPAAALARTYAFLGLRPHLLPESAFAREMNPTTGRKADLAPGLLAALRDAYAIDLAELRALVPELDLTLWPTAVAAGLG